LKIDRVLAITMLLLNRRRIGDIVLQPDGTLLVTAIQPDEPWLEGGSAQLWLGC
jgi:hypothetical protein